MFPSISYIVYILSKKFYVVNTKMQAKQANLSQHTLLSVKEILHVYAPELTKTHVVVGCC